MGKIKCVSWIFFFSFIAQNLLPPKNLKFGFSFYLADSGSFMLIWKIRKKIEISNIFFLQKNQKYIYIFFLRGASLPCTFLDIPK